MSSRRKRNQSPEYGLLPDRLSRRRNNETKYDTTLVSNVSKFIEPEVGDSKIVYSKQSEVSYTHSKTESTSSPPSRLIFDGSIISSLQNNPKECKYPIDK